MASHKRLAALQLMDRIQRHEIETLGAELAALRASQADLEAQGTQLRADALREASDSTPDTRVFLPAYLQSVDTRLLALSHERDLIEEQAATIETELMLAFRTSKTNEMVLGRVADEIALEGERLLAAEQDDATRALYLLHQRAGAAS